MRWKRSFGEINMIERYRVFISGNQKELEKERLAVKGAILNNAVLRRF